MEAPKHAPTSLAALIVGKAKAQGEHGNEPHSEEMEAAGRKAAIKELVAALKDGDHEAIDSALSNYVAMCQR